MTWSFKICSYLQLNINRATLEKLAESYSRHDRLKLYSDVPLTLKKLKSRKIKIAIATSTPRFLFENAIVPIEDYVDVVITGWEAKASKPDIKIFQKALKELQTKPETAVVVGDNERLDILPAKKLGMTTVLVDRKGETKQHSAEFKIRSLTEIVKLFHLQDYLLTL
jgi:putative hydrolase of the HAD superfamily